jgi:hypothetical protein
VATYRDQLILTIVTLLQEFFYMMNKKILAVSIAAAFTFNANANIDLASATTQLVTFGSESIITADADVGTTGNTVVANAANLLDVVSPTGFTVPATGTYYIRFDLSAGQFETAATDAHLSIAGATDVLVQGGTDGDNFVIYSIADTGADAVIASTEVLTFSPVNLSIGSASNTVTYSLYAAPGDATTQTSALFTDSTSMTVISAVSTGEFAVPSTDDVTALASTGFTGFGTTGTASVDLESDIGEIDVDTLLTGVTAFEPDGSALVIADVILANQIVTVTGDVSVGTWSLNTADTCDAVTPVALVKATGNTSAASAATDVVTNDLFVCVDNQTTTTGNPTTAVAIPRSAYTVTIGAFGTDTLASISYDTTSIEVNYLTTNPLYNQKLFITNNSGSAAAYTTTFKTEGLVSDVDGAKATGTIAANSMVVIKAVDLVTLTGGTRASAVIEIEADSTQIQATSQTVRLDLGTTDTEILTER